MHYTVSAVLNESTAAEFHRKLTDGTIDAQKPDGREIVASMKRAKIDPDGRVRWSEQCFCESPLAHERETVYDRHFTDMQIEPADDYADFDGADLMAHLSRA